MRRYITWITVLVLSIALFVFLPGCESDTEKAKGYMQAGDNKINDIKGESAELEDLSNEINGMIEAMFEGKVPSSKDMQKKVDEFNSAVEKINKDGDAAIKQYKNTIGLKSAGGYSNYARKAIEYVDTMKELYKKYGEMLNYITETLKKYESGETIESATFSTTLQNSFNELREISSKAEEINDERSQIKKKKKL